MSVVARNHTASGQGQPTKRCPDKYRYTSRLDALMALSYVRAKGRDEKRIYRCRHCRGFHLTRQLQRWPEGQWPMGLA